MKKPIRLFLAVCLLFFIAGFLPAQTAAELEAILNEPAVTCAQAAMFVLGSAGSALVQNDAFAQAAAMGWLPGNAAPNDHITMGELSYLCMKAFGIKGGVMYAIFPGPRYAYRTMKIRSFIQGVADPAMKISGERFLHILGNVLGAAGGEK